jgi:predicted lipid-binding transport protein (Tim44 family)
MGNIPTDIIVYAVIAGVLLIWLRNVLGTRHGAERQRPNPFTVPQAATAAAAATASNTPSVRGATSAVDAGMVQISLSDRNFDAARFLENAKDAFAIVVTAFADGDRTALKDLLAPDVYKSFDAGITSREKAGQKAIAEVLSVRDAAIIDAKLDKRTASITVRFKADETYALTDASGKTIAGHPERVVTMTDVWTFARDIKSTDPRWLVTETRDDVKEADGMTLPEAGISV